MSSPEIVTHESNFHIQPSDLRVDSDMQYMGLFGTFSAACEAEVAAAWIVFYAQQKNGWYPFTWKEMVAFRREHKNRPSGLFNLNELVEKGYIREDSREGPFYVTDEFIETCPRARFIDEMQVVDSSLAHRFIESSSVQKPKKNNFISKWLKSK